MQFAENLISFRKQRGWSQEELGNQIHVTRQTISKWEMGQSTPELEKLVELSKLFSMSLDELVGLSETVEGVDKFTPHGKKVEVLSFGVTYEYVSSVKVFGLPLVHIRWGFGPQLAKGIVAIGNCAVGVVTVGGCSLGLFSIGGVSIGLILALGGVSLGLAALGGVAIGGFAVGGLAIGQWIAIGGGACSNYLAIGGGAFSKGVAIGGSAYGHVAVGKQDAVGTYAFLRGHPSETVWTIIKQEFPHMWDWVKGVVQTILG